MRPLLVVLVALAFDDRGVVLGDNDLAGATEHVDVDGLELKSDLLGDDLATAEDRDVLQHRLAAIAEPGGLYGSRVERSADLVDNERCESLALNVLGNDQQRLARLHDLLEDGKQIPNGRDLLLCNQDVRVVEHDLHPVLVGHEVRADVALVELHPLDELELEAEGVRLLYRDDSVLTDLVHRVGNELADLGVGGRDGGDLRDLGLRRRLGPAT